MPSQAGRESVEQELRDHGKEFRVDPALSDDDGVFRGGRERGTITITIKTAHHGHRTAPLGSREGKK